MRHETERGNHAFGSGEGSEVLFIEEDQKGKFLEVSITPDNYPAWSVGTVHLYGEELHDHIMYKLGGWFVRKCNLESINIDSVSCVVDAEITISEVAEHVVSLATDNDFNPTMTVGALVDAIDDSSTALDVYMTSKMRLDCAKVIIEGLE